MAEKKETVKEVKQSDMVTVMLPKAREGELKVRFVAINGKTYSVEKGVKVPVPRAVAEVLQHAQEADDERDAYIEAHVSDNK